VSQSSLALAPRHAPSLPFPLVAAAALAGGMVAMGASGAVLVKLLLAIAAATSVFALRARWWAIVPILLTELTLSNYLIPELGLSLRLLTALVAAIACLGALASRDWLGDPRLRRVVLPALAFVALATLGNLAHSETDYVFKYFRYQLTQVVALVVVIALVHDRAHLRKLVLIAVAFGLATTLFALWQRFDPGTAVAAVPADLAHWKGRALGLTSNPVLLANNLNFVLLPLFGVMVVLPARMNTRLSTLAILAVLVAVGVYVTYTRSAVLAIAPGLAVIALLVSGRMRATILGVILAVGFLFVMLQGTGIIGARYYRDASADRSAASHEALWEVGLAIALANPIEGIGHSEFQDVSTEFVSQVSSDVQQVGGDSAVGKAQPHNDFLSVWLSWGILALVPYCALFLGALRNCLEVARSRDPFIRGLAIGCAGGLATYATNSAFHNYLDSSVALWLYAALSAVLATLPQPRASRPAARDLLRAWSERAVRTGVLAPSRGFTWSM
jgi:O-antigen ligase